MACTIQAWLEDGEPRLQVLDNHSGHLRMAWKPNKKQNGNPGDWDAADAKSLFRTLLDLSAIEHLANPSNQRGHS